MNLKENLDLINDRIGKNNIVVTKSLLIGNEEQLEGAIIYINGLASKDIIDRDVLHPLMLHIKENLKDKPNIMEYISKKYITMSNTKIEKDINNILSSLKRGQTALLLENSDESIIIDTSSGDYRSISEPTNESSIRGSREGFIEKLETNTSIIKRRIRDENLVIENMVLGRRTQRDLAIIYIDNIVDKNVLQELKYKLSSIDVDSVPLMGYIQQYIENDAYSIFPQSRTTERPDIVEGNLMEGRIAVMLEGTPMVLLTPSIFIEFFQAIEDYTQRTIVSSFTRILRALSVIIVITFPSIYLTLIKFNAELIPIKFVNTIIQSRSNIPLTPFMEILSMEIIVEFLREGGLRLPPKVNQTLSVVGGIIIGQAAIKAGIVSSSTLLIIGISIIAAFLTPNYDMSLAVRFIRFPMLILSNYLGLLGLTAGFFFLLVHICSLESLGVPYFSFHNEEYKDIFIRSPLWTMNKRPDSIPNNNPIRQTDFRKKFRRKKDE
ncbi:spore germination protein [Clostridium sporogenes]|uniref:Spore germination protein KA n=1 Tax=Clostridium sporogenes TaxID=1509 RepID=A0A7U4XSN9_CLOSG|nr:MULTISPECIES: spore germination protein [Clostridium]AJD30881.1 GerA spore germination family protein [Clostridium botulinum Prevot_594]AKC61029.1 spore germination protein KA [Clostridium sporogenes]EHN14957.1 spore germination protein GerA [Clostridium sporogenes PA 3679]KCZ70057.1 spore germination protein KA [Clostridium sporogenes]KRU44854.1 spore germination protein [Clostridium sporogenes]